MIEQENLVLVILENKNKIPMYVMIKQENLVLVIPENKKNPDVCYDQAGTPSSYNHRIEDEDKAPCYQGGRK